MCVGVKHAAEQHKLLYIKGEGNQLKLMFLHFEYYKVSPSFDRNYCITFFELKGSYLIHMRKFVSAGYMVHT